MDSLTIVTVSYSFDSEVVALLFNSYEEASKYIKEDFESEKASDIENGYEIDDFTYCNDDCAVLSTKYRDGLGTTTWTIANVIDKR